MFRSFRLAYCPRAFSLRVPIFTKPRDSDINPPTGTRFESQLRPVHLKRQRTVTIRLDGQTTGGNQRSINGGAFFFLALPTSGIELDLPLIGRFPEKDRPDVG